MKISNRIRKISEFVNENSFILDVGCDHALLDIYLALEKNCICLATDINKNPLKKAQENIDFYKVNDRVKLQEINGIPNILKKVDYLIISGMGAITIKNIIDNGNLNYIDNIIICPNNEEELIRKTLNNKNYKLKDEVLVKDKKIIYPIILFSKGKECLSRKEILYGKFLSKNNNKLFFEYYYFKLKVLLEIKFKLPKNKLIKIININKKIRDIKDIL